MDRFIVASTRPYIGKSGIVLALLDIVAERGTSTAYFKPYGTMPAGVQGVLTDLDAAYISRHTASDAPLDAVCPVVESTTFLEEVAAGKRGDLRPHVAAAFDVVSEGVDLVIIEGPSDIFQGRSVDLSLHQVAELLDARVLLVTTGERPVLPDPVLGAADSLGDKLAGVLFNNIAPLAEEFVKRDAAPFLRARGITVFGTVPHDTMLSSVTINEIVEELAGTVLSAADHLDDRAESFLVGAMGQDKALRFFRRLARKVVVTGGDRSDVQLAALETDTAAIVLTGDLLPSAHVLSRAEELGVPMVLVGYDTLSTVERLDRMFGRIRLHDPVKAARMRQVLTEAVDCDAMLAQLLGTH